MRTWTAFMLAFCTAAVWGLASASAQAVDLAKIDRTIRKEPAYKGKPKYCLVVLGPEAKTRIWLVLDGDVLYVDRKGNGDLTEPENRVVKPFRIGGITEVEGITQTHHFDFMLLRANGGIQLSLIVKGRRGQYACLYPDGPLQFADRPQDAPIVHFNGPLELRVCRAYIATQGETRTLNLIAYLGTSGLGKGTFAYSSTRDFLIPKDLKPRVEVEFAGKVKGAAPILRRLELAADE
jgi:hypothetical protein